VIGTGSSAMQSIPLIAELAAHLRVLQRTPNFSVPARNAALDLEHERRVKAEYSEFRRRTRVEARLHHGRAQLDEGAGGLGRGAAPPVRGAVGRAGFALLAAFANVLTSK
jgi:cation diffusion facilitator CzcD-associated flavoprotein CzcO